MTRKSAPQTNRTKADPNLPAESAAADAAASAPGEGDAADAAEPISANKASVARAAKAREGRLAAALRTNLSRRKAAARAASEVEPDDPAE
ncbi:MAG: hypothetical protein P0Y66_07630 [Candidatus Kaistia colombiensis]|nr:MAG: hypothetical protein P0Y66_07630 [Kaistia sp.]